MNNLLGNAVKFSQVHDNIHVSIQTVKDNNGNEKEIKVFVADEGIGIAKEDLENIFLKFKKAENLPEGIPPGTGLGLAISKEIICRLGGNIWAGSTLCKCL